MPSSSALKKDFNFAYIFELLLSSRFKKQCQILEWIYSKTAETYHVACRRLLHITTVILSFQWQNYLEETNFIISLQKGWEIHNTNYLKLKDWPSLIIRDIWLLIFFLQSRGRPKTLWLYHWFGLSSFFNLFSDSLCTLDIHAEKVNVILLGCHSLRRKKGEFWTQWKLCIVYIIRFFFSLKLCIIIWFCT